MTVESAENVASVFLADIFGASTVAPVFICSLPNADAPAGEPRECHVATRHPDHIERFLQRWDRKDRALYFCTATIKSGATTRSKATLAELNGLHVDIDFKAITIGAEEADRKLQQVMLLPSKVVASGGGLHAYWLFKEALPATPDNIERVEALLRLLADHLGGDLACAEASRLMRLPGSHNTKNGAWTAVRVVAERPARYELDDLAEWLEAASPVIHRTPTDEKDGNGADTDNPWLAVAARFGNKPPIDVEARLAAMTFQGAGDASIHSTQVSVSAALLNRGHPVDEVVDILLTATRAAAGQFGARWNWRREEHAIRQMCDSWIAKHPEVRERQSADAESQQQNAKPTTLHWHGEVDPAETRAWLVQGLLISGPGELQSAFENAARQRVDALMIQPSLDQVRVAELALTHRLPAASLTSLFVRAGGLMSFSANYAELWREMAVYVVKILNGANPATLPVAQPTKFALIINLKTAKALGLQVPLQLQQLADELIE